MVAPGYEGPYLLGIDYGTESCRAAIFDLRGTPIGFAATGTPPITRIRDGRNKTPQTGGKL